MQEIMTDRAASELLHHNLFEGVKWTSTAFCDILTYQDRTLKFTVIDNGVMVEAF